MGAWRTGAGVLCTCAVGSMAAAAGPAERGVRVEAVMYEDQLAPWRSDGVTLRSNHGYYVAQGLPDGTVLLEAVLHRPGATTDYATDAAVAIWDRGTLTKVIQNGDLIGPEQREVDGVFGVAVSPDGKTVGLNVGTSRPWEFEDIWAKSAFVTNRQGAVGDPATFQLIGQWTGDTLDTWVGAVNDHGLAAVNQDGWSLAVATAGSEMTRLADLGAELPDGTPVVYGGLRPLSLDNAGRTLFVAATGWPFLAPAGIYSGVPGDLRRIVGVHDPVPGLAGARFATIGTPGLFADANAAGQVAFIATLEGEGIADGNRKGIWTTATQDGALSLVSRIPDDEQSALQINARGDILFRAALAGADGVPHTGLWLWRDGVLTNVVTEGAGFSDGTFSWLMNWGLGDDGTVAFSGSVATDGAGWYTGEWAGRPGDLHLLVRSGDRLDIEGSDVALTGFWFGGGSDEFAVTPDGRVFTQLSWAGETAGGQGLFLLSVPEPSGTGIGLVVVLGILRNRRRV